MDLHGTLTKERVGAYERVFAGKPTAAFPYTSLSSDPKHSGVCIDVFVYTLHVKCEHVYVLVTNGMSDQRLSDGETAPVSQRFELLQYVRNYSLAHAVRLFEMAWLPHFDKFVLDAGDTIEWPFPGVSESRWQHGFFLQPFLAQHRDCEMTLEGDEVSFLWYIPVSDDELTFKREEGLDTFLVLLDESELPWIFDESSRISMI